MPTDRLLLSLRGGGNNRFVGGGVADRSLVSPRVICKNEKLRVKFFIKENTLGKRGPKSMSELMISDGPNGIINRPDAPYTLTDAEADEWKAVVASMPPEHFARIHYSMLTQLCRHKVQSDRIGQLIEAVCKQKKLNQVEYDHLLTMQARETSSIIRLMRSMRLTQQSLYRGETAKLRPVAMVKAPWEPDD
jgi:hypothetical protein